MALAAKVLVFAVVSLITAEVTTFASFLIGQAFITSPAPHATLSSPGALRAMAGTGLFLCVAGLFALGIAAIVRHTAGAIGAYVFVVLVLPIINQSLPSSLGNQLRRFLPLTIGNAMTSPSAVPHAFGPWTELAILCGYTAAALVLGTVLLVRRDA
jgi:ABC-2 type transport system permease protein